MTVADTQKMKAEVYNIVGQIPRGKVLTYGDIAILTGFPRLSRMVGHILASVPSTLRLPCHRVVNANGRLAPHWPGQQKLLEAEGVRVIKCNNGTAKIPLKKYRLHLSGLSL